jgi:hypothetical protein
MHNKSLRLRCFRSLSRRALSRRRKCKENAIMCTHTECIRITVRTFRTILIQDHAFRNVSFTPRSVPVLRLGVDKPVTVYFRDQRFFLNSVSLPYFFLYLGESKRPSLAFLHQNPVCMSPVSHTCHMPNPSHSSLIDHPNNE